MKVKNSTGDCLKDICSNGRNLPFETYMLTEVFKGDMDTLLKTFASAVLLAKAIVDALW